MYQVHFNGDSNCSRLSDIVCEGHVLESSDTALLGPESFCNEGG